MPLPLRIGARGEDVRDLHLRLAAAGFAVKDAPSDTFAASTLEAIHAFQAARGLPTIDACDAITWHQLVEAGLRLGDRLLYRHTPMQRGDDVADLQLRLGSLGFDAGRVDGIFGPDTERALIDFQRNAGLPTDGIAGPDTIRELCRFGAKADLQDPVAVVRERERLRRAPRTLVERRVVIGDRGGAAALVLATARQLRTLGASVITIHHPDESRHAADANAAMAELYLAVDIAAEPTCAARYFATTGFVSTGGHRLAQLLATTLHDTPQSVCETAGNRTSVLRETRMPAVSLTVGPASVVRAHLATFATALAHAVEHWFLDPVADARVEDEARTDAPPAEGSTQGV